MNHPKKVNRKPRPREWWIPKVETSGVYRVSKSDSPHQPMFIRVREVRKAR